MKVISQVNTIGCINYGIFMETDYTPCRAWTYTGVQFLVLTSKIGYITPISALHVNFFLKLTTKW